MEPTDRDKLKISKKERDRERCEEVATLRHQIKERERECTDAVETIKELQKKEHKKDAEKEQLETMAKLRYWRTKFGKKTGTRQHSNSVGDLGNSVK